MNVEKVKIRKHRIWIAIAITAILAFSVTKVVIDAELEYLSHFKFKTEAVRFNSQWLNFTIRFVELPQDGARFSKVTVDNFQHDLSDAHFFTGDALTVQVLHKGSFAEIPDYAHLWGWEIGWDIKLQEGWENYGY